MTRESALDAAHAAMQAAPEDARLRLGFYAELAACELVLALEAEPDGENIAPRSVTVEGAEYVLAFDNEERLAEFAGGEAPYAALPGRALAGMLAAQGLGLALNPGVAPSEILLPPEAMAWLAETLAEGPAETRARLREFRPPAGLPEVLLTALDARLARAAGLASAAWLVATIDDEGALGHMLAIVDAIPGAEGALAQAVSEAVRFSGLETAALDVAFFSREDPVLARLQRVGLRFDLPVPDPASDPAKAPPGAAPGMDPARPPRLK